MQYLRVTCAALFLTTFALPAIASDFAISPTGIFPNFAWNVSIGANPATHNPPLQLLRGRTYTFSVSQITGSIHTFYINTTNTTDMLHEYTDGITGLTHTADSTFTFVVPQSAPDTLFYNCSNHFSMAGTINIDGVFADGFE
jgi:hypothetical protein